MNNLDPYKILNIHKNYNNDSKIIIIVKKSSRWVIKKVFNLVSLAYKKLHEEYKLKQINNLMI